MIPWPPLILAFEGSGQELIRVDVPRMNGRQLVPGLLEPQGFCSHNCIGHFKSSSMTGKSD